MDFLTDWLTNWLKELLIGGIMGNLEGLFDTVNTQVGEIAAQVGTTPAAWHAGVFSLIRQLSETVILPIAGMVLTFVATYELIQMLLEKNNIVEFQTNEFGRQDYKEEDALRVLQWESMSLLLELYYSAILNAYKPNSYLHLINSEYVDFGKADTYKIERILAHELAGKIDVFISECEKVYDHRVSVKNTMIRRMVRHLMMTSKKISKGQMDKAKSVFLNDQKQPDILFLRASNSSD